MANMCTKLLNLSGGIDSTAGLYLHYKNFPDQRLLIHHVRLIDYQGRQPYETKAVHDILDYFRNVLNWENFIYMETSKDSGHCHRPMRNVESVAVMTSEVLLQAVARNVKIIYYTAIKNDMMRQGIRERQASRERIYRALLPNRQLTAEKPLVHLWKKDVMKILPPELLALCWYCRTPQDGEICGKCHTCREVKGEFTHVTALRITA